MQYEELITTLQHLGKDPSRLIFEDELTGINNRRFLLNYFEHKVHWDALDRSPVSLLMMDLDYFKQINDTHGHQSGDQALLFVGRLLREVAGDQGLPIRYGGDEFMILLPEGPKREALQLGERLLQRVHEEPLHLEDGKPDLHLTFSIGVASAPEDAQTGKALVQKADTALYHAKKSGRDRVADASELAPQEVFGKAVLHQLQGANIAGRSAQLAQVAEALNKFGQRQSQFLVVEGAAGMGKTTFLDSIRRNLAQSEVRLVKVNGVQQEGFRPYYLATSLLVSLLNQREDKGAGIFETLSPNEISFLANLLPQLSGGQDLRLAEDDAAKREGIFNTVVGFLPKLVDSKPLILLIDDLQFADEATLMVFRALLLRREIPLFVCGTVTETIAAKEGEQATPLERFRSAEQQELGITRIVLKPLSVTDIAGHLRSLFPQLSAPPDLEKQLAQITQGNPLFLGEILRKLVMDQKVALEEQQWVIQPLEEGYLPKTLEEIVTQKIAALDEESQQLLAQASTFGEDVSLSALTGSSEKTEAKVLEFVDQAAALGLISTEFQLDDETIRFLGKRVLEITYGGIREDRKQALHERIGTYQEALYQQRLLPSASYLAYHFKRSANREKAKTYEQVQVAYSTRVFNAQEAVTYLGDLTGETLLDTPLAPSSLPLVPNVIRSLQTAVRNIRLYPPESKTIVTANQQLMEAINQVLANNERLNIVQSKQALLANGQKLDVSEYKFVAEAFLNFLSRVELQGLAFHKGLTEPELKALLEAFGRIKSEAIDQRFWERYSTEHHLTHINLKQVRYTERGTPKVTLSQVVTADQRSERESVGQVHEVIRGLLSAARNIKLFPLHSKTTITSIEQLMDALRRFLGRRPALTLARASNALLVNGQRIDTSEFKVLADGFLEFLHSIELGSITFLPQVSLKEVEAFIGALRQLPSTGLGAEFWKGFGRAQGLANILLNELRYEVGAASTLKESGTGQVVEEAGGTPVLVEVGPGQLIEETVGSMPASEWDEQVANEPFDAFLAALPERVNDLLLKGAGRPIQRMFVRLFKGFGTQEPPIREKILDVSRDLLKNTPMGFQQEFAKLIADPLLRAFAEEKDAKALGELATLMHRMASTVIQFSEYLLASRLLTGLHNRHRELEEAKDARAQVIAKVVERKLEPGTQKLLAEDLKSGDPTRHQHAAKLIGSLGQVTMPLLLDVIKREQDLRVRQLAASLLAEQGPKAAKALKRELVLEVTPEERARMLDVSDTVTRILRTELTYALGDPNPEVRQAAFRLAERLGDRQVAELLLEYAAHEHTELATGAIKCLGKVKPAGAVAVLSAMIHSAKEADRAVACCQALGQIGDPAAVELLAGILVPKGFPLFRKKWHPEIRAAAAFAMAQISDPRVAQVLASLVDDGDPRVKQIARATSKK